MNRVHFEERVKAVPADMNDLHIETEVSLGELIEALTGGADTVLFENAPPLASHSAPSILINIPEQWFAANGIYGKIPATVVSRPDVPDWHAVYFVNYRTDVTGTRDRYTLAGGVVTVAPETVIIRKPSNCRIEVTSSGNPLIAPPVPTLGPNDIGYVKLCDVVWDGVLLTMTHNVADLYSFPGAGIVFANHAIQHLPGGTDPIQLAAMGGHPTGSRVGLMPPGSFVFVDHAVQDVEPAGTSPFIAVALTGGNTPGTTTPLTAEIDLKIDNSLAVVNVGGNLKLGLSFRTGPRAGQSDQPARYDHTHSPGETPFGFDVARIDVDSSNLGTVITVPSFQAYARIQSVQVFWLPPSSSSDPYPMMECGWASIQAGTVGVRAHLVGANSLVLEVGSVALIEMSAGIEALALAAVGGSPSWTFAGYTNRPTSGHLMVRVVGER